MHKKVIIISILLIAGIWLYSNSFNVDDNYDKLNTNKIVAYIDGKRTGNIPGIDDGYIVDKIECDNDVNASWNSESWGIVLKNLNNSNIKCSVYFISDSIHEFEFEFDPDNDGNGQVQTFTVPFDGTYKLETWGAQGGYGGYGLPDNKIGGYGAYATGLIELNKDNNLYIYVGGKGKQYDGGYNGGGNGIYVNSSPEYSGGGGGATHVATISGLLSSLSVSDIGEKIIIIAGGGGGGSTCATQDGNIIVAGGSGGGKIGGSNYRNYATGASQTGSGTISSGHGRTGSFGQGGNGYSSGSICQSAGGGGGGYYGGVSNRYSGTGGSGYIGSSKLLSSNGITKHMTCYSCTESSEPGTKTDSNTCHNATATSDCAKEGNGFARITLISRS